LVRVGSHMLRVEHISEVTCRDAYDVLLAKLFCVPKMKRNGIVVNNVKIP